MAPTYRTLISLANLRLAWRRITTAGNVPYKRFFRPLIEGYEVGLDQNLRDLHERLKGGWEPGHPNKIYVPKPSGLQRPISLLGLEDQILLQAVANVIATKVWKRRKKLEGRVAFSSVLNRDKSSVFFLERWQDSYKGFHQKVKQIFSSGRVWVAHFDFAAFYETIAHDGLLRIVAPLSHRSQLWGTVKAWLQAWCSEEGAMALTQGIPQGPGASNFLAEVFLMPLDEAMVRAGTPYARYVDDIRILGRTENEVRRAAISFEIKCKQLGLIPQARKFGIRRATTLKEALGSLPSMPRGASDPALMGEARALSALRSALSGRPHRITDKTRARFVLFHAPRSRRILRKVIQLLPHHPEHIDAFCAYFSLFERSKPLECALVEQLASRSPYAYVSGELWRVLARIGSRDSLRRTIAASKRDLGEHADALTLQWGALAFLLRCQALGLCRATGRLKRAHPLVQALLVNSLPDAEYGPRGAVGHLLSSSHYEPGIVLAGELVERRLSHRSYGISARTLCPQVQNVFRGMGLILRRPASEYDAIGHVLAKRYGVPLWPKWRRLLGREYSHALQILLAGDAVFETARSSWLEHQDSFNNALLLRVLDRLGASGLPGAMTHKDPKGRWIDYGRLLSHSSPFSVHHADVANEFRRAHTRRNRLPSAHPYDKKTGTRASHLRLRERDALWASLSRAYARLIALLDPHL